MKRSIIGLLAALAFCVAGVASAQPCAGFNDVASPCNEVEWLKNRSITAIVNAVVTGLADAVVGWRGSVVFSTDAGGTYQNTATSVGIRATAAANEWSSIAPIVSIPIAPNTSYRFAIFFRRDDQVPGTTGNFTQGRCQLIAQIVNQNGTSSPF